MESIQSINAREGRMERKERERERERERDTVSLFVHRMRVFEE